MGLAAKKTIKEALRNRRKWCSSALDRCYTLNHACYTALCARNPLQIRHIYVDILASQGRAFGAKTSAMRILRNELGQRPPVSCDIGLRCHPMYPAAAIFGISDLDFVWLSL